MLPVEQPFKTYTGIDGKPLNNGYVYFGVAGQDPITHPVTVYWDAAGTLPVSQPARTINGYIVNDANAPANIFFDGSYSEKVIDSKGRTVFYAATSDEFSVSQALVTSFASPGGSGRIGYGAATVLTALDGARPLSYYGTDQTALSSLLNYAKTTSKPIRLDAHVTLTSDLTVDLLGAKLVLDFGGFSVRGDNVKLSLRNPGDNSIIIQPEMRNITAPWVITRWTASDTWIPDGAAVLATLAQSNAAGYYQPTVNDADIWSSLTSAQQNQNVSATLYVYGATGLLVQNPRGRHCLYEFDMCNYTSVVNPQILLGGKGTYGTILFKNMETTGYGVANFVRGGFVRNGSFCAVTFMRNKRGGVTDFTPYRSGESGVKTYQNEVGGRSARCYDMYFADISPYQTVYDGVDFNADIGAAAERVDDYPLATYPWNQLPTGHKVHNVRAVGCNGVGIWGDGQFVEYSDCDAKDCHSAGVWLRVTSSEISGATAINCNAKNLTSGVHQITIEGGYNRLIEPRTHTDATITQGIAIYTSSSTTETIDEHCTGNITTVSIFRGNKAANNLILGTQGTNDTVSIFGQPHGSNVTNPSAVINMLLTSAVPGAEQGVLQAFVRDSGVVQRGLLIYPQAGGHLQAAVMNAYNPGYIQPGYAALYDDAGALKIIYKSAGGVVKTGTLIP
jgi:hypothetical protein